MKKRYVDILATLFVILIAVQVVLILVSWLITAVTPQYHVRSLLSSEGVRWFFGSFVNNLTSPVLIWFLLLAMTVGTWHRAVPRHRTIIISPLVWLEVGLVAIVMLLLTAVPHAILLSVTGTLFPSSFSNSILPVLCSTVMLCAITIGLTNNHLHNISDVYRSMTAGIHAVACLFPIYIAATELFCSLRFVLFYV